jgi:hypothetical protein
MKKVKMILIIIGILALPFLYAYIVSTEGPFGEYMLYRKIKNGYFGYAKDYLEKYPNGKYAKRVELLNSQSEFNDAKALATDTTYLYCNDRCEKIFAFIKKYKISPEYPEALKMAEEFGYNNYIRLKDWSRIYAYMELFPNSPHTKELTILKNQIIDSALFKIDQLIIGKKLNKNQAELLKAILNGSKNLSHQMAICLKFIPEILIRGPQNFKQFSYDGSIIDGNQITSDVQNFPEFSIFLFNQALSERLFEAFSKFLPGKNFFKFDTVQIKNNPVFEIKCRVSNLLVNGNSGIEKPYIGEYFNEKIPTKTVKTTKRVSQYSPVQKDWVYKDVTETKTEIDYNGPRSYTHAGYFFYLMFDIKCIVYLPGNGDQYIVDFVYKPEVTTAPDSQRLKTIYDLTTNEAIWEFTRKIIPDLEYEKGKRDIKAE